MTLKLDERIYEDRRIIFNCFSAEDAKKYVGQKGYFADEIYSYGDLDFTDFGTLDGVDNDQLPFKTGRLFYQFFLPAEFVRPVGTPAEKKWRPFTLDEFRTKFPLLSPVTFRRKTSKVPQAFCFVGYTANGAIILGSDWCSFDVLFADYELKDEDGNWTPFGVEVE